jgi:hypothetical protein
VSITVLKLLGKIPQKNAVEIDTYYNNEAKKNV